MAEQTDTGLPSGSDWGAGGGGRSVASQPARLLLVGRRWTVWLFAMGAAATLTAHSIDRWTGTLDPLDRVAQPVLATVLAALAYVTVSMPVRVATWQRAGSLVLAAYFALQPVAWALGATSTWQAHAIAGLVPWMLLGCLALFIAWPPRAAMMASLVLAATFPLPLLFRRWWDDAGGDPSAEIWSLILGACLAMSVFAGTLYVLARELQRLLLHLAPQIDPSQHWFTVDDVAKRRIEEMDAARRFAQDASRAKSAFLANMSHEIRTPMNGVLGMADLLARTQLDEQQRGYVRTIQNSGRLMMALLNNILDLSKIEAGRVELEVVAFSLRRLLETCIDLSRPAATAKGLTLNLELEADLPVLVRGDRLKLQQTIGNLMSNAVKFTDQGSVTLVVTREAMPGPSAYRFAVRDTGVGVPEAKRHHIFEPFMQVDTSPRRRHGGSGLGLSIVRHLVAVMGGDIGLDSEPGCGSTFWFVVRLPDHEGETEIGSPWMDSAFDGASPMPDQAPMPAWRVLLVDDNDVNVLYGKELLRQYGHSVEVATDGWQAVAAALRSHHDIILMDCQMPGMDGFEATRRIRAHESRSGSPRRVIIAVTASALDEDRRRCEDAGMDDMLAKPYTPEQFQAALRRHLGG